LLAENGAQEVWTGKAEHGVVDDNDNIAFTMAL
jgi:hypothetical protein